jgi:hypothetical protein
MKIFFDIYKISRQKAILYSLFSILCLSSCDKVSYDVQPPQPPVIPQSTTEVFKQMYPDVKEFIFKPLERDKTWQNDFIAPSGKVISLVDYQGEIIDLNLLVGTPKTLPNALKQSVYNNYPTAQIAVVYDIIKNSNQNDGYKVVVQTDKSTLLNLFFDANNNFLKEEKYQAEKVSAIIFTSTDQINFDDKVPAVVKQFVSNNQFKSASVIIYSLNDNSQKIILNYRERQNGALLTSEITISEQGAVLQWLSPIESEFSYKTLNNSGLPTEVTTFLNTNFTGWALDYAVSEVAFGKNKTNYVTIKNGATERFTVIDNEIEKNDLVLIRSQVLEEKDLPQTIRDAINLGYSGSTFVSGSVTFDPRYQATRQGGITPDHYQIEVKQGTDRYAIRLANDGKVIFRYRIL